jgi:beta-N-acetylhexosaminidase
MYSVLFFIPFIFCVCIQKKSGDGTGMENVNRIAAGTVSAGSAAVSDVFQPDIKRRAAARDAAERLSDHELAGQIIMAGVDACGSVSSGEKTRLRRVKPGAIMLFRKNLDAGQISIRNANAEISQSCRIVSGLSGGSILPFIACDNEGGDVRRFRKGVAELPAPFSYGQPERTMSREAILRKIQNDAEAAAREMFDRGVNMNLAPVAEPLTKENNAFLSTRSYGYDAVWTAEAVFYFMTGMEKSGVACVIKHFPGNSGIDPHENAPVLNTSGENLDKVIYPFSIMINTGVPAGVMVSHVIVSAWDDKRSASLSPIVIQEKLADGLSFYGIKLADDFSMGAVSGSLHTEKAVIKAVSSGIDMVMAWPANLVSIHNAVYDSIVSGALSRERILDAVERILYQKIRFGLMNCSAVDGEYQN